MQISDNIAFMLPKLITTADSNPTKFMIEIQLRNSRFYHLELPSSSPLIRELKQVALDRDEFVEARLARLIQLPLDGGRGALAFSSADLTHLRLIPESKIQVLGSTEVLGPRTSKVNGPPEENRGPFQQQPDPMETGKGLLGGYISARHVESKTRATKHGDSGTWKPELWDWAHAELGVESVLDVGCGEGHSTPYFQGLGCRVLGIDGSSRAKRDRFIPDFDLQHDYADGPLIPDCHFDMVWCCDFVEHIEERFSQNILATFANASKYIFLTHALPCQPDWHHVNCQPRAYWINKIERLGYHLDENLVKKARELSQGHFSRTGLVFVRTDQAEKNQDLPIMIESGRQHNRADKSLAINHMEITSINGVRFYLFLDIFVHPSRQKVVAIMPCYFDDWDIGELGIDFQNVELIIGKTRVVGRYISHRLDSWEPCALLDFEHEKLTGCLNSGEFVGFTIQAGPHRQNFKISALPEPSYGVLMSLVVKNENRWICHFLKYYLECLEVDHILVYDNGTKDQQELQNILTPYLEAGTVTYIPWDYLWRNINAPRKMIAQPQQEAHSLNRFANSRWIGFLDVDEFLRLPGKTLSAFLSDFERADVDGLSFGLRWFHYEGALDFEEVIDPPLTFLHSGRDILGRKRQKLMVSPKRTRFLRLHSLEDHRRELQVDDTDLYFHHYNQRDFRFDKPLGQNCRRDDFMLQFSRQLGLEWFGKQRPPKPKNEQGWVRHIARAIAGAETARSRLNTDALEVNGMCGVTTRHFYNNICNFEGCRYLEIGSFEGASTVAVIYGNKVDAVCIDNFSEFRGTREKFERNIGRFPHEGNLQLIEKNCFSLNAADLGEFDVYLYDGAHSRENQYKAIAHFAPALAPLSLVIIDDWNWERVRVGTEEAILDAGIPVIYKKEILLPEEDLVDMPKHRGKDSWWNGICIMLLGRPGDRS